MIKFEYFTIYSKLKKFNYIKDAKFILRNNNAER